LNYNPEIKILKFELFIEPTRFEIEIMMFSMDKEGNEIFNKKKEQRKYFSGSIKIGKKAYYLKRFESEKEEEIYNENYNEVEKDIIAWFIDCWNKSNCKKVKLPCYIGIHDDSNLFDLKNLKWTNISIF
jgi:hypothetical protein